MFITTRSDELFDFGWIFSGGFSPVTYGILLCVAFSESTFEQLGSSWSSALSTMFLATPDACFLEEVLRGDFSWLALLWPTS